MKNYYYYYFLIIPLLLSACSTGNISQQFSPQKNLTVFNKRGEQRDISLKDFIQPKETQAILDKNIFPSTADLYFIEEVIHFVKTLPYRKDSSDFWNYVPETLKNGGDCEDKAHLLASLLIQSGFPDVYVVKGEIKQGLLKIRKGHTWVELTLDHKKYILETLPTKKNIRKSLKNCGYFPFFKYNDKEIFYCIESKIDA